MLSLILLFGACGPGGPSPMLEGSIRSTEGEVSAEVYGYKAFGFDNEGLLLVYISSNPDTTCEIASEFLRSGRDPYDPVNIYSPGTCNIQVKIGDYSSPWEAKDDRMLSASSSISCAMGEGEFVLIALVQWLLHIQ